jgi:hypothetical protein
MTRRKKIPQKIETDVLVRSKRKCCLCYFLENDFATKVGQIAHLDHNPSNNIFDNLVWLCFEHHNQYDGKTSQSKNFQINEVKIYREKLYKSNQISDNSSRAEIEKNISQNPATKHNKNKDISITNHGTLLNNKFQFISIKKDEIHKEDRDFLIVNNKYYYINDWGLLRWLVGINRKVKITNLEKQKRYENESYFNQYNPGEEILDQWNFGDYVELKMDDEFYNCAYDVLSYLRTFNKSIMITEIQKHLKYKDNLNYNEQLLYKVMYYLTINDFIIDGKIMGVMAYHITPLGNKAPQEGLYKHLPPYIVKEKWKEIV